MENAPLKRGLAPLHPGVHLEDALKGLKAEAGLTIAAAAERLGVSRRALYNVLEAKRPVSAELAVRLEAFGLGSAESWLNLQLAFDLWQAREDLAEAVKAIPKSWPVRKDRAA
jgi:addiction module HigA family antidote